MTDREYFKARLLLEKEKQDTKKGVKFICPDCGFKFYDLEDNVCPNCLKVLDNEVIMC